MKKILFFIVSFFLMINNVGALTLECPFVASPGEIITCAIKEDVHIGIKAKYKYDSNFLYQGIDVDTSWKKYYEMDDGFSFGNVSNEDKFAMNVDVKVDDNTLVNKDYLIELIDIEVVDKEYKNIKLDNLSSTVKILSNNNLLKSLNVSNGKLKPSFSSDVTSYELNVDSDTIVISAEVDDKDSVLSGDIGEKKLEYGVNNFVVSVTSARGSVRNYYLYVTRKVKEISKSSDFTLKSLEISSGKLDFDKNNFFYSVDVSYEVDNIDIKAVANDDKASVEIKKPDVLEVGENTIEVIVTAQDGTVGKYLLVVNRSHKLSSDASIKRIIIRNYDIELVKDIYYYELEIGSEDKLDIEVILGDDKAKYEISGNSNLKNNSVINIEVVAEDGTILNYKIKIIKIDDSNSSFIINGISVFVLSGLIVLGILVIVVKIIKDINN